MSEEIKSCKINLRVSPSEKEKIYSKAKNARMTVSQYLLSLSDEKKIYVVDCVPELLVEITRIGVNINQIARIGNTQKFVTKEQLDILQSHLEDIQRMMYQIVRELYHDNDELQDIKALNKTVNRLVEELKERNNGDS